MKNVLPSLMLLLPLAAQKMPLPDGSQRVVALLDVGDLLGKPQEGEAVPTGRSAQAGQSLQRIAEFVRAFADPPLGDEVDLQPLGGHYLVALGAPERVAAVEKLLAHARQATANQFFLDLRILSVSHVRFEHDLQPKLGPPAGGASPGGPRVAVLSAAETRTLLAAVKADAKSRIVQAPQLVTQSLQNATIAIGEQIAYVRDFELEVAQATFLADPIVDTIWHGQHVEAICAELPDGTIGVQMEVLDQLVERPIREVKTTVPGSTLEVTVQVPRTTGCRGRQVAALPKGTTAVMAAKKNDGTWLVTLLTVTAIGEAQRAKLR